MPTTFKFINHACFTMTHEGHTIILILISMAAPRISMILKLNIFLFLMAISTILAVQ